MGKIYQLPPHIVAKIAAGEVIERPAFAVKELIENAIDAGADAIEIYVEQSGLKKIQVIDNGEGMSEQDLRECIKPHTTSKIRQDDDLVGINSLGFRGEALASLAAVSTITIKTRTKDSPLGTQLTVHNGNNIHVSPIGTPEGTNVIVEQLFASVPARKKFLKSAQTEFRHITELVASYALSYPQCRFLLIHNNRTVFDFPKHQDIKERLTTVLGAEIVSHMLPVQANESYISLQGFIAKPQIYSSTQNKQYLFINNRKVTDKLVSMAVKESFGTMLEPTTHPVFVLFVTIAPEMVDVNVHPRKEHVIFLNNQLVFQTVKQTITAMLNEHNITFQNLSWKRSGVGTTHTYAGRLLKETVLDKDALTPQVSSPVVQFHNLYLLTQTKSGLLFVDQHAAHERVLFEKLVKEFGKQKTNKPYKLSHSTPLQLSAAEKLLVEEYMEPLKHLGFVIEKSNKKVCITHVPLLFKDRNPQEIFRELLEDLEQDKPIKDIDTVSMEMIAFLACRAAVKAGDKLEKNQMQTIIDQLEESPNNATCPHGRPTKVFYALEEINKSFKR